MKVEINNYGTATHSRIKQQNAPHAIIKTSTEKTMRSAIKILCILSLCVTALTLVGCVGDEQPPSLINTTAPIETTPSPNVTTPISEDSTSPIETTLADTTPSQTTPAQTTPPDTTTPPEFDGWSDFH